MGIKKGKSLKETLFVHLVIALLLAIVTSFIVQDIAIRTEENIQKKYITDKSEFYEWQNAYAEKFGELPPLPTVAVNAMSGKERFLSELCDFAQSWSILIFSFLSVFIALSLFYNRRLKKPFHILNNGAEKIGNQELNFQIFYDKEDELGQLCDSFEKMREQLQMNNVAMWKMIDEQKQMRAAFSHDLRTPLSVLKGYVEYLILYYPKEKLTSEKIMETLGELLEQTMRIEKFADTMKDINHLDEIQVKKQLVDTNVLYKKTTAVFEVLAEKYGKHFTVQNMISQTQINIDIDIYLEIIENIANNAMRYAKNDIQLEMIDMENWLMIDLKDDGKGFTDEEILKATKPYYHGKNADSQHYGMGLYICERLSQKHGGKLSLHNKGTGGACVKVQFNIR